MASFSLNIMSRTLVYLREFLKMQRGYTIPVQNKILWKGRGKSIYKGIYKSICKSIDMIRTQSMTPEAVLSSAFFLPIKQTHSPAKYDYRIIGIFLRMMLRSKDAIRIVPCFALPQSCPIFGYRGVYTPLLSSYLGGSLSHITTHVQAHRG